MKKLLIAIAACILSAGVSYGQQEKGMNDLQVLYGYMQGSFSSQQQSKNDTDYYDIRLHMSPIWPESNNGKWLYVEQAMVSALDKPYRQRFYKLIQLADGSIESIVYTVSDPLRFAGAWKTPEMFEQLSVDSLELRDGCSIILRKLDDGSFKGSTNANNCPSNLRGATYATSEVVVQHDKMISWDRGFDSRDKQVWGAEKGGYIFMKELK
jgi:CpeT protein